MVLDAFRDVFFRLCFLCEQYNAILRKREKPIILILHHIEVYAIFLCKKGEQTFIYHSHRHFSILLEISVFALGPGASELIVRKSQKNATVAYVTYSLCLALRGSRWFGVVWGWELTCLSRLSHDDGTFTQGKLPQITTLLNY